MDFERKLTEQEHAVLVNQAKLLSGPVGKVELLADEKVPAILATLLQKPLNTESSNRNIKNGLISDTMSLEKICLKPERLSDDEHLQVPHLIRRIRDQLILNYDAMQEIRADMLGGSKYCTPQDYAALAVRLHLVGVFLRMHPTRLFTIIGRSGQEMTKIMFEETMGESALHAESAKVLEIHQSSRHCVVLSPVPTRLQLLAGCHRATFKFLLLVSQLWMRVAQDSSNETHKKLAWARIMEFSSKNIEIRAFTNAMAAVLQPEILRPNMRAFLMKGGIKALICSWMVNHDADSKLPHAVILESLDPDIWKQQSEESILRIMNTLLIKLETFSAPSDAGARFTYAIIDNLTSTPLFQQILHLIYVAFGLPPFDYVAKRARRSVLFPFLLCRIKRHPERYREREQFGRLIDKCVRLTKGSVDRYVWLMCEYGARNAILEKGSCGNARCPSRKVYRERFHTLELTEVEERELDMWGTQMKICARCRMVMYCTKHCQREGWPWHKTYCLKGREYHLRHDPEPEVLSP